MLDGFLVGVLLQRRPVPLARWWPAVFDGDGPTPVGAGAEPHDAVYPWVAGFAHAMASFEDLGDTDDPAFDEPLALLYQHLDPADLEDADLLLDVIRALPPPQDLAEAVEQLVRATLLIADETRPIAPPRSR